MTVIRAEHLRRLLESPEGEPALVLVGGEVRVVPVAALDEPANRGALLVATREDLKALRPGGPGEPSEDDLERLAAGLDTALAEQGG